MILYFSATGNTEYIAKEIAQRLNDECINLLDRVKRLTIAFFTPTHLLLSVHQFMYVRCLDL